MLGNIQQSDGPASAPRSADYHKSRLSGVIITPKLELPASRGDFLAKPHVSISTTMPWVVAQHKKLLGLAERTQTFRHNTLRRSYCYPLPASLGDLVWKYFK